MFITLCQSQDYGSIPRHVLALPQHLVAKIKGKSLSPSPHIPTEEGLPLE